MKDEELTVKTDDFNSSDLDNDTSFLASEYPTFQNFSLQVFLNPNMIL